MSAFARRTILRSAVTAALAAAAGARAQAAGPAAPIQRLSDALAKVGGSSAPFLQRIDQLAPALDAAFDLDAILRSSVGPRWEELSADDQKRLADVFRRFTIASYVANLAKPEAPAVTPEARALPDGDQVVDTEAGGTKVSYVMHQTAAGWRAIDVLADGSISRVAVQRSDFRQVLAKGGAPALISSLEQKLAELSS